MSPSRGGIRLFCRRHPKYQGVRRPTAVCDPCHDLWVVVQDAKENVAAFDVELGNGKELIKDDA